MTKFLLIFTFLLAAFPVFAQDDRPRNEVSIQFEAVRQKVQLNVVPNFTFNPDTDSAGFSFEYLRKVNSVLGIGARTGVQFGGEDRSGQVFQCGTGCTRTINTPSQIALGYYSGVARLQSSSKNAFVRPYVEVTGGFSRQHFTGGGPAGPGQWATVHGNSYTYGGGAGLDFKLSKNVALRVGADYLNTRGLEGRRHNVLLHAGPVFRFGKR